ncbi:hypothetical protein ACRAKI_09645 [Saccharothrix isguenensis]
MTEHDRFPEFVAATVLRDVDVNAGVHDEHVRHEVYLRALADATPPDDLPVITRALGDPDQVMAVSAVVRHLDRMGESHPDFGTWAEAVLPVLGGREFPTLCLPITPSMQVRARSGQGLGMAHEGARAPRARRLARRDDRLCCFDWPTWA